MNNYVKVPENLIVIDFDLKDDNKQKSLLMNLEAASKRSPTYAELGAGAHLHLIARSKIKDGDVAMVDIESIQFLDTGNLLHENDIFFRKKEEL